MASLASYRNPVNDIAHSLNPNLGGKIDEDSLLESSEHGRIKLPREVGCTQDKHLQIITDSRGNEQ